MLFFTDLVLVLIIFRNIAQIHIAQTVKQLLESNNVKGKTWPTPYPDLDATDFPEYDRLTY